MTDVLQFYVSGFWVWLGITYGIVVTFAGLANVLRAILSRTP